MDLHIANNNLVNFIEQNVRFDHIKQVNSATNMQSYTVSINSNTHIRYATEENLDHRVVTAIKRKFDTGILYPGFNFGFMFALMAGLAAGWKDINQMISCGLTGATVGVLVVPFFSGNLNVNNVRFFFVRLFVIILASGVVGAFSNTDAGAAMGAIGGAFVGSSIAGVSNRAINFKSVVKATFFAIALGALIGTAIGAAAGTILGSILGAIIAGMVAVAYEKLEAVVRTILTTGTFDEIVKFVAGIFATVERDDIKAMIVGIFIGIILISRLTGNGIFIGAVAGAVSYRASNYEMHVGNPMLEQVDDITATSIVYVVILAFIWLCLVYFCTVIGVGASGAAGGIVFAAYIGIFFAQLGIPDMFRYRAKFAALAGFIGGGYAILFYSSAIRRFSVEAMIPEQIVGSMILAIAGAAVGGYLFIVVMNRADDRLVAIGAVTRFLNRAIQIIAAIIKAGRALYSRIVDQSIVLGAIGALVGGVTAFGVDLIIEGRLAGAAVGAVWGAVAGTSGGAVTIIATVLVREIAIPTVASCTNQEIKAIITSTAISGFIGGVIGGHLTSNVVVGGLIGLIFSVVNAVSLIAITYIARRHRIILVPLTDIVNKFGTAKGQGNLNDWTQYTITTATRN